MANYLIDYLLAMGFTSLMISFIILVMIWDLVWKLFAMWKAARNSSVGWFVALLVFNTAGILPILYIYVFSEMKRHKAVWKSRKKRR